MANRLLLVLSVAAVRLSAGAVLGKGKVFLGNGMQPEVVARTLSSVEDEWRAQAAVFAECNSTVGLPGSTIVNCADAPTSFGKSCGTVVSAIVQGSGGDRDVAKEYMVDVCSQGAISGWHQQQCHSLALAVQSAMSADKYSNRVSFSTGKLCNNFWARFLADEQSRIAQEKAEREAAEKQAAEEETAEREAAEKKAAEEAERRKKDQAQRERHEAETKAAEATARTAEAAARVAQKKAEAEAVAQAAKQKMAEVESAERERKKAAAAANATEEAISTAIKAQPARVAAKVAAEASPAESKPAAAAAPVAGGATVNSKKGNAGAVPTAAKKTGTAALKPAELVAANNSIAAPVNKSVGPNR